MKLTISWKSAWRDLSFQKIFFTFLYEQALNCCFSSKIQKFYEILNFVHLLGQNTEFHEWVCHTKISLNK